MDLFRVGRHEMLQHISRWLWTSMLKRISAACLMTDLVTENKASLPSTSQLPDLASVSIPLWSKLILRLDCGCEEEGLSEIVLIGHVSPDEVDVEGSVELYDFEQVSNLLLEAFYAIFGGFPAQITMSYTVTLRSLSPSTGESLRRFSRKVRALLICL
jgi:hypothetical protein